MFIIVIFITFVSIQKNYSMDNIKKIVTKEYTKDGINVQHFYYEKIIIKPKDAGKKENLLSNYIVTRKTDNTMLKSIDGGLNWFLFTTENSQELNFEIYPNPSADVLNVRLENVQEQIQNISIYDITGKIVNDYIMIDFISNSLDIHNLPTGMYILAISSNSSHNKALQFFKQ